MDVLRCARLIVRNGRSPYTVLMTLLKQDHKLQTETVTPELIDYIVRKIVTAVSPIKIILFGSQASGQETDESDLDLLIIHNSPTSNRKVRQQIDKLLWGRRFGIDLVVRRPQEVVQNVEDNNPFYTQNILTEGVVLYERSRESAS